VDVLCSRFGFCRLSLGIAVHEMDEKTAGRAVDAIDLLMKSEAEQRHETCPLLVVYFTEREHRRGDTLAERRTTVASAPLHDRRREAVEAKVREQEGVLPAPVFV
jgi:hypothetical protein